MFLKDGWRMALKSLLLPNKCHYPHDQVRLLLLFPPAVDLEQLLEAGNVTPTSLVILSAFYPIKSSFCRHKLPFFLVEMQHVLE